MVYFITVVKISKENKWSFSHLLFSNFFGGSVSHMDFPSLLSTVFLSIIYIYIQCTPGFLPRDSLTLQVCCSFFSHHGYFSEAFDFSEILDTRQAFANSDSVLCSTIILVCCSAYDQGKVRSSSCSPIRRTRDNFLPH